MAGLWKPTSAREIADRARIQTSQCSAQLTRLIDRGAVEVSGGSTRRKLYYLTERLYNIYYLMRRARGPAPLIDALIRFMEAYYSTDELKTFVARMAQEALGSDGDAMPLHQMALERLFRLPSLKAHREEMLSHSSQVFADAHGEAVADRTSSIVQGLINTALENTECGRSESAIADWERVVQECEQGTMPVDVELMGLALIRKGNVLFRLGRVEEALAEWDDVIRRFDTGQSENEHKAIAAALMCKYEIFNKMDRYAEALASCNEVIRRIGNCLTPELQKLLAGALLGRIVSLHDLNRYHEVLKACDEMRERFDRSGLSAFQEELAVAMLAHTTALLALNRVDDAIRTWSTLAERCGADDSARIIRLVASGPIDISTALFESEQYADALTLLDRVVNKYELGPVDTHRPAITPATRSMRAGTRTTVPPARVAIPRNAPHSRRRSRSGAAGPPGPGQAPHHGPSPPGRNDGPDPPRVRIGGRGIGIRGPARNAGPAARTVRRRIRAPSLMTEWGHGPHRGGW